MTLFKKLTLGGVILLLFFSIASAGEVDPFYLNLFKEGKSLYNQGNFRPAIKSLTIAEFGMLANTKMVTEVRFYLAISQYKLGQVNLFKEIIKKIELENGWTTANQMVIPAEIKQEILTLMAAHSGAVKAIGKASKTRRNGKQPGNFNLIFARGLQEINQNNLANLKRTIKSLKKINKRDPRVDFLSGALACKQKKYSRCIKYLLPVVKTITPALKSDVYYYLSLSYYFEKNYGQTLAFYYKISDQSLRNKLSQVIKQVLEVRNGEIEKIVRQFNERSMAKLLKQFPGDSYICTDLLAKLISLYQTKSDSQKVRQILFACLKFPDGYNQEFILKSAAFLEQLGEIPQAIGLIQGSKFFKIKTKQEIEILYRLGELYMNTYNFKKAREYFLQVKRLQSDYRKTDFYIDRIKKIQYNK